MDARERRSAAALKGATAVFASAVLFCAAVLFARQSAALRSVEVKVLTVVHAEGGFAVLLAEKTARHPEPGGTVRAMVIHVGENEAQAIALALAGRKLPRPMTHDLTVELLRRLGAKMTAVVIHTMQDDTFFARLELESKDGSLALDCRPSDGLALALRSGAAVRVSPVLLKDVRVPDQPKGALPPGHPPVPGLSPQPL